MSHPNHRPRSSGSRRRIVAAAALLALAATAADATPRPAEAPGIPPVGVKRFRLPADGSPARFRLLVVPVRFPEDLILGGGGVDSLRTRLAGDERDDLRGFFRAATRGRLLVEPTLAPLVVADHARSFYTEEGEGNLGFGLDPDAYPHNARFLVEEVTRKISAAADFRVFDNTGDGLADGLLLLHSGPSAPEGAVSLPRSYLLAHAFTLDRPVARGDGAVFAYAVAATADPIGPWAHEVGHLLGLPDLYVSNPFFPGDGVGEWSLMATGANVDGGRAPAGLDAASRYFLGETVVPADGSMQSLEPGVMLRAFRPQASSGPEFFLIERRSGADGLYVPTPATIVYRIDERMGDNRDSRRPLVEVRAVLCEGTGECAARLDDGTIPSLRDGAGDPTGLVLTSLRDAVRVTIDPPYGIVLMEAALASPFGEIGARRVRIGVRNASSRASRVTLALEESPGGGACPVPPGAEVARTLAPAESWIDSTWTVRACSGGALPDSLRLRIRWTDEGVAREETRVLVVLLDGLPASRLSEFEPRSLAAGREQPWRPGEGAWTTGESIARFVDAVLESPAFRVPPSARLLVDHAWSLDAPARDVALDAARVEILLGDTDPVPLEPELGWGYEAERGTGNALAGRSVLAGTGSAIHVFDLAAFSGQTVVVRFRVTGDADPSGGFWTLRTVSVQAASDEEYVLDLPGGGVSAVPPADADPATRVLLYAGPGGVSPVELLAEGTGAAPPSAVDRSDPSSRRRYSAVWVSPNGRAGSATIETAVPDPLSRVLLVPSPNPVHRGGPQLWSVDLPADVPAGRTVFRLVSPAGTLVATREATFEEAGRRSATWDGRDAMGRRPATGMYFLQCTFPDGRATARKVVILP